jgi:hypothetical protein
MKVYPIRLDIEQINIIKLKEYEIKREISSYIFTPEGLYELGFNNIVYQLVPEDKKIEKCYINNYSFFIDRSYYKKEIIYQIPYHHFLENIEKIYYKIDKSSDITLIIEYHPDTKKFKDVYFILNKNLDNLDSYIIQEDLLSFLSYLK